MRRAGTLPLGIDVGTTRVRVALVELDAKRTPRLVAVASRAVENDPAPAVAAAVAELGSRERRCVLALALPDAHLYAAHFPALSRRERDRAARFEATRAGSIAPSDAAVRVVPLDVTRCIIGVAHRGTLAARIAAARRAGVRPLAVDDAAFALCRAYARADAIIDIGMDATRIVIRDEPIPTVRSFPIGGRAFTAAASAAFGIDDGAAENRKRNVGLSGAGERVRDELIALLAETIVEARAGARREIRSIVLTGNGSRLHGFGAALHRAVAIPVDGGTLSAQPGRLPPDVVSAAAPDWALALGLALWPLAS